MRKQIGQSIVPFATVAMVLVLTAFTGCERKPEVYTARGNDPAYKEALKEMRTRQNKKVVVRDRIVSQMEELIAYARRALPQGATDEQVRAELEGNPQKYPAWASLTNALAKANGELAGEMARTRDVVRARILKEAVDRKSVAEGRAVEKKKSTAAK